MIFDITPFRSDKNIGKAYNERIKHLPKGSWIIIRDADCMYLTPDYGNIIERIIMDYGADYDVIGALTNRLGVEELCYKGKFSDNMDIRYHIGIANMLKSEQGIKEVDLVAGFFMMFTKETWESVGGFSENILDAPYSDKRFCKKIKDNGGKIGIARNLYLFHAYRPWETNRENAQRSTKHLSP
jgi:GT2 family glycosyltransferase